MSAYERGRRSIRTATAVVAGTGLGVAAAVGGIAVAQSHPLAEQVTRQNTTIDDAGSSVQDGLPGIPTEQGSAGGQGRRDPGIAPSEGMTDQQDPGQQGWGGQEWNGHGMQDQGVSPGQGPAMGNSHGS